MWEAGAPGELDSMKAADSMETAPSSTAGEDGTEGDAALGEEANAT